MFDAISSALYALFNIFLGLLPNADAPTLNFITAYTGDFRTTLATLNWFFPVETLFLVFQIIIAIEGGILSWYILKTVIKLSPAGWGSSW